MPGKRVLVPRLINTEFASLECSPNESAQPTLRQSFSQRINGSDPAQVNKTFFPTLYNLWFGMVHRARLGRPQFSKYHHFFTHMEVVFKKRQIPPAAMKSACSIIQDDLENRFGVLLEPFDTQGKDFALRDGRFVQLQFGYRTEMPAIFIATRPVQKQFFHCANVQLGQKHCPFRANSP